MAIRPFPENPAERMSYPLSAIVLAVLTLHAAGAHAGGAGTPMFSLQGFGTLGIVRSSEDNADFVGSFFHPNGAGHTRRWSADVDSNLGVQGSASFNDRLAAVVQIVSQHHYDNTYTPQLEWANLKYEFTPDFSVRLGRTVAPSFMLSESRLVSYAHPWVRPPLEVYGVLPVTNKDGIDAAYRFYVGDVVNSVQASYGQTAVKLPGGGDIEVKRFLDVNGTLEYGAGSVRLGYTSFRFDFRTPGLDALFAGLAQLGSTLSAMPGLQAAAAQAASLVDRYRTIDVSYSIVTAGVNFRPGDWLLMAEWSSQRSAAVVADTQAWYATAGYRIGKFTPYLTLAQLKAEKLSEPGLSTAGLPSSLAQTAAALNGGIDAAMSGFRFAQKSASIGVRWDFMSSAALKLQYERLRTESGSAGRLGNVQPDFRPGGEINVFSTSVDFVF